MREPKVADEVVGERLRAVLAQPVISEVAGSRAGAGPREALGDLDRVGEPLRWSDIIPAWAQEDDPSAAPGPPPAPTGDGLARAAGWATSGFPVGTAWASTPAESPSEPAAIDADQRPHPPSSGPAESGRRVDSPSPPSAVAPPSPEAPPSPTSVPPPTEPRSPAASPFPDGVAPSYAEQRLPGGSHSPDEPLRRGWRPDERAPLAPPAWVLPEPQPLEEPADPLDGLGVSQSWVYEGGASGEEAGLSGSGAFGGPEQGERRIGLRAFDPGRRGVRALAVVAVLVVLVAGFLAWRARPQVDPVAAPSFGAGAGDPVASASAATVVVVAVAGKVRKPGLVRLPPGARVADALTAAGGAEPGIDVSMLNLARKVVDGELILVGVAASPGAGAPVVPTAGGVAGTAGGLVNLNTATLADLDTLPGVGPVLAQRILDARTAQGGFKAVSDLRKVSGIGDARYDQLKDLVTV